MSLGSESQAWSLVGGGLEKILQVCLREARTQGLGVTQEWGVEEQRCEHKRRDTTEKMTRSQGPMKTLDAMILKIETYTISVEI